jgi:hypothetical protein
MKTKWIASMTGGLLPFIMAALLFLTTTGCEKETPILYGDSLEPETELSGNIISETFSVDPEGSNVNLFNGAVSMTFPEGAVSSLTEFTLVTFPLHHLDMDGINMYKRGYALEGPSSKLIFPNGVTFNARYDLNEASWKKSVPNNEENLTIYYVSPTLYAYERIVSIGYCCVDCDSKIVKGCIGQCGFYVVGEN